MIPYSISKDNREIFILFASIVTISVHLRKSLSFDSHFHLIRSWMISHLIHTYIREILYDNRTDNFTSGVHNFASEICKFLLCACADLRFVKWRNGNSFYWLQKAAILVVVTSDCLLPEPNRLLKDLLD